MKLVVMVVADDYCSEIDSPITIQEFTLDCFDKVDPLYFTWFIANKVVLPAKEGNINWLKKS